MNRPKPRCNLILLFRLPMAALLLLFGAIQTVSAQEDGATSAEARAKAAWLWEYFRENPPAPDKLAEISTLYRQLDLEGAEACDGLAFATLAVWQDKGPDQAARLAAALSEAHAARRAAARERSVTTEESAEARSKICYLFDHFVETGPARSKVPVLVEMYTRLTTYDRSAVDSRLTAQVGSLRDTDAARADELQAILETMQQEGETVVLPAAASGGAAAEPKAFTPSTDQWPALQANLILGTQAIGGPYQFSDRPYLLEVAHEIAAMGSNLIKFNAVFEGAPYNMAKEEGIESLSDLFEKHSVYRELMTMPFTYFHIWTYPAVETKWQDGLDEAEEKALYDELRDFAAYLLAKYNGTGKQFYLGHWEGDWYLSGATDPKVDPTPERIAAFTRYLQTRQRAVDDARRETPHENVAIFNYVEVNQVVKGLDGTRPTVTNAVLEKVNPDFVSYSCYDVLAEPDRAAALHRALDEIEAKLSPKDGIEGKRVFVGEFAVKASLTGFDGEKHAAANREFLRAIVEWGCPFALYWQFYCNERNPDHALGQEGYWLVDARNEKTPLYEFFRDYYRELREFIERETAGGKSPDNEAIRAEALRILRPS
jgi:hypothetical protein